MAARILRSFKSFWSCKVRVRRLEGYQTIPTGQSAIGSIITVRRQDEAEHVEMTLLSLLA